MYDIFGCASDFAHNFRHLMPTTLNCGTTVLRDVDVIVDLIYIRYCRGELLNENYKGRDISS